MVSGVENGKASSKCPSKFILSFPKDKDSILGTGLSRHYCFTPNP
jgi:hypothetical protein